MARGKVTKLTTDQLLFKKKEDITKAEESLKELKKEYHDLELRKEQEDKNEIYNLIKQAGLSKEGLEKLLSKK